MALPRPRIEIRRESVTGSEKEFTYQRLAGNSKVTDEAEETFKNRGYVAKKVAKRFPGEPIFFIGDNGKVVRIEVIDGKVVSTPLPG
jgi:hypothetical protein